MVNQILYQMKRSDETRIALEKALVEKALQQECVEARYDDLVALARRGIDFLNQVHEGDVLTREWIAESQKLVALAIACIQEEHSSI